MNKQIIGTLVGGIILFIWQFLSWGPLNIHKAELKYTDKQDEVMQAINGLNLDPGTYMIPHAPSDMSMEDAQKSVEQYLGKNWARVSIHENYNIDMGSNMFRSIVVNLIAVFLLIWILLRFEHRDFMTCMMASWAIGIMAFLTIPYMNHIWLESSSIGYLIDVIVQWGLVGAWLGWWLNRK